MNKQNNLMEEYKTSKGDKNFDIIFSGSFIFLFFYSFFIKGSSISLFFKFTYLSIPTVLLYTLLSYDSSKFFIYENGAIKLQVGLFKKIIDIEKDEIQHIKIYNNHGRFSNPSIIIKYDNNLELIFRCGFSHDTMIALKDSLKKYYADRMTYYVDGYEQYL